MANDLKIDLIRTATGCSLSEAKIASEVSGKNEESAIGLIRYIRPKYLAIKGHFTGSGVRSVEGLVLIILEDARESPIYCTTVVVNYSEDPLSVNTSQSLTYWQQFIASNRREQNRYNIESSLEIKDYIETRILPETGFLLWNAARETKELRSSDLPERERERKLADHEKLSRDTLMRFLEGYFKMTLKMEMGMELLTELQFHEVAKSLGISSQSDSEADAAAADAALASEKKINLSVVIQGDTVIDSSDGTPCRELKVGDRIAIDITERSPTAEHIGKLLGLKRSGIWFHAWGNVKKIAALDSGKYRLHVEIARNVYIESITPGNGKIRVEKRQLSGRHPEVVLESPSVVSGYLVMAGITVFFTIIVKILMVMVNR